MVWAAHYLSVAEAKQSRNTEALKQIQKINKTVTVNARCKIWSFHDGEDSSWDLLDCNTTTQKPSTWKLLKCFPTLKASSGENKWHLLSLKCFNLNSVASKNSKLKTTQFSDPFLCICFIQNL